MRIFLTSSCLCTYKGTEFLANHAVVLKHSYVKLVLGIYETMAISFSTIKYLFVPDIFIKFARKEIKDEDDSIFVNTKICIRGKKYCITDYHRTRVMPISWI